MIIMLLLLLVGSMGPGGVESAVLLLLLGVQAVWLIVRFGSWIKSIVEHAVGMDSGEPAK